MYQDKCVHITLLWKGRTLKLSKVEHLMEFDIQKKDLNKETG